MIVSTFFEPDSPRESEAGFFLKVIEVPVLPGYISYLIILYDEQMKTHDLFKCRASTAFYLRNSQHSQHNTKLF